MIAVALFVVAAAGCQSPRETFATTVHEGKRVELKKGNRADHRAMKKAAEEARKASEGIVFGPSK